MIVVIVCIYFLFSGSKLKFVRIMVVFLVVFQLDVIFDGCVIKYYDQYWSKIMEDYDDDVVGVVFFIIIFLCFKVLVVCVRVILNLGIEQGRNWNGQ